MQKGNITRDMTRFETGKKISAWAIAAVMAVVMCFSMAMPAQAATEHGGLLTTPWALKSEGKTICYVESREAGLQVLTGLRIKYYDSVEKQQNAAVDPVVTVEKVQEKLPKETKIMSVREAVDFISRKNAKNAKKEEPAEDDATVQLCYSSTVKETKRVKHKVKVIKTDKLQKGEKEVHVAGTEGKYYEESEITQVNNDVIEKNVMKSNVVQEPTTEIIYEGTALTSEDKGMAIVALGKNYLGNPYVWGGESLENGVDCSGFTMLLYHHYGISLPHSSAAQGSCGQEVSQSEMQPGDLIVYTGHVAIYAGNGCIIHAAGEGLGIRIDDGIRADNIKHIRRIFGTDQDTSRDEDFPSVAEIKAAYESATGFDYDKEKNHSHQPSQPQRQDEQIQPEPKKPEEPLDELQEEKAPDDDTAKETP